MLFGLLVGWWRLLREQRPAGERGGWGDLAARGKGSRGCGGEVAGAACLRRRERGGLDEGVELWALGGGV